MLVKVWNGNHNLVILHPWLPMETFSNTSNHNIFTVMGLGKDMRIENFYKDGVFNGLIGCIEEIGGFDM